MIIKSDNTATNVLINKVEFDYINQYIKKELKLEKCTLQEEILLEVLTLNQ